MPASLCHTAQPGNSSSTAAARRSFCEGFDWLPARLRAASRSSGAASPVTRPAGPIESGIGDQHRRRVELERFSVIVDDDASLVFIIIYPVKFENPGYFSGGHSRPDLKMLDVGVGHRKRKVFSKGLQHGPFGIELTRIEVGGERSRRGPCPDPCLSPCRHGGEDDGRSPRVAWQSVSRPAPCQGDPQSSSRRSVVVAGVAVPERCGCLCLRGCGCRWAS